MKDIIAQIQDLYTTMTTRVKLLNEELARAEEMKAQAIAAGDNNAEEKADLNKRAAGITASEKGIATAEQLDALRTKLNEDLAAFQLDKSNFITYKSGERQKLDQEKIAIDAVWKEVKSKEASLADEVKKRTQAMIDRLKKDNLA